MTRNTNVTPDEVLASTENTRSLTIAADDENVVVAHLSVRKKEGAQPVNLIARISFSGVSARQTRIWAARMKVIDLQRALRLCDQAFLEDLARKGPICRHATSAGSLFTDPAKTQQKVLSTFNSMSPEERAALLAALNAANK